MPATLCCSYHLSWDKLRNLCKVWVNAINDEICIMSSNINSVAYVQKEHNDEVDAIRYKHGRKSNYTHSSESDNEPITSESDNSTSRDKK